MNPLTYSLKLNKHSSDGFYDDLSKTTDIILSSIPESIILSAEKFRQYVSSSSVEIPRSKNEYVIEAIMIGLFWKIYSERSSNVSTLILLILKVLYKMRKKIRPLKKNIDIIRGRLITKYLYFPELKRVPETTVSGFKKLIHYMEASGDFNEEAARFKNWFAFFKKDGEDISSKINLFEKYSEDFIKVCGKKLGKYTDGVGIFTKRNETAYNNKENILFCLRDEKEYFLNMVCAEILNREFRTEFERADRVIVLLPTCMRNTPTNCKAIKQGNEIKCALCNPECRVFKITIQLKKNNMETRLIPHSSEFSEYLKLWKGRKDTGLVGIACVLNLLKGGYEMRKLDIPSQCIFLDYCGCKNHWHDKGIPTDINVSRLEPYKR